MAHLHPSGKITLNSSAKFFRLGQPLGDSTGSEMTQEFEISRDPGDTDADVQRAVIQTQRSLADKVLLAEYLRGSITGAELESRRAKLKARYAKLLGEDQDPAQEAHGDS